jgi:hypothetical protein
MAVLGGHEPDLAQVARPAVVGVARREAVEVLEHEGHAAQRSVGQLALGRLERLLEGGVDDGVHVAVHPLGPLDGRLDQLHRAGLATPDELGLCGGVEPGQVVTHGPPP